MHSKSPLAPGEAPLPKSPSARLGGAAPPLAPVGATPP
jgi:hypothetical protein